MLLSAIVLAAAIASPSVPPGVARVSVIASGTIVVTRSDKKKTQVAGTVNLPVFAGDSIAATDADTLAEIQLDGYTALRLSGGVQAQLAANDAKMREIDLERGLVELGVLHAEDGIAEVVTPSAVLRATKPGEFRIWVGTSGETSVTARRGEADLVLSSGTFRVEEGKTLLVRGDPDRPSLQSVEGVADDALDRFSRERDRALFAALNENTNVPSSIASYDNLDRYGRWADVAPYGESWIPDQNANWAPYRDGTWVWGSSAYGWTWVANEPWGWLPYHYGSWFYANGYGWCWYPPALGIVPVWVPAFVAFFGYGANAYGFPYYGWVPLAPYETFYPWYPWYWGWYYPWPRWQHTFPPPPAPPARHHRGPIRMHPMTGTYRNALAGGASAFDSHAAREGMKIAPIRFDPQRFTRVTIRRDPQPVALPIERSGEPVRRATVPQSARASGPSLAPGAPALPELPQSHLPMYGGPAPRAVSAPVERAPSAPVVHGRDAAPIERGGDRGSSRPPPP